jgi:D-sedoheptulose 7-phosphate isomerase
MTDEIRKRFDDAARTIEQTGQELAGPIARAVEAIVASYRSGGGVLLFGNGGSAADAQHVAGELVGRFLKERRGLSAVALTADASVLTSLANDYGYEHVFSRQVQALGRAGDVAIGISTSGNSANVLAGLRAARQAGMTTIAMTGAGGGACADLADILLAVPETHTPRIQQAQQVIYHVICEMVERDAAQ